MALLEWYYILPAIIVFCVWLFTTVKRFHKQINKKNNRVPDIKVLQKIIPPSCDNGWKVKTVCNALPVWSYSTSFTFAPRHLVASRTVLPAKSSRILEELKNIKVFSMIFPYFPSFKQQKRKSENGDVLYLSNMFSSLSLPNILLSGQQTELMFERCWSSQSNMAWLYVTPTVQLLTSRYGYWICFFIIDKEHDNTSVLHTLASYPDEVSSHTVYQMITSCQVLIKEHVDSIQQEGIPISSDSPKQDSVKLKKISRNSSPVSKSLIENTPQKPQLSTKETYGHVEEPAVIKHLASQGQFNAPHKGNTDPSDTTPKQREGSPKTRIDKDTAVKQPKKDETPQKKVQAKSAQKDVVINKKIEPYLDIISDGYKLLLSVYEADENTEGWDLFNQKNDVTVHKRLGTEDFPNDIYKGKGVIKVPLPYLLNYLLDIQYKPEFDDVFESGSTVEELGDGMTKVISLIYKNIWPVTGRDFCSISAPRHVKDNLYGIMIKCVTHPECPERKNKVRGECIIGGFILEDVSADTTNITFVVCANFNGYIPSKIVNKVTADQPLSVGVIRKKVEQRYKNKDPSTSGEEVIKQMRSIPSVYPEEKIELEIVSETDVDETVNSKDEEQVENGEVESTAQFVNEPDIVIKEASKLECPQQGLLNNSGPSTPVQIKRNILPPKEFQDPEESSSPTINVTVESQLSSGFDLKEDHYTYADQPLQIPLKIADDMSDDDSGSIGDLSQSTDDGNMYQSSLSVDEPVEYPRDPTGEIDFVILGNQCSTSLEEEFASALKVDMTVKNDPAKQEKDAWKYQGTSKDVIIMRKVASKQKFYSFLGRGIINALPVTVWEMIRTPTTRFVYDSMLKKITTVKEINETMKVVHMRHETHACFVKQARDFCFLTCEKVKEQKYMLCGTSVEATVCPVSSDCVRGTIFSSGWIIEPIVQNGKSCSLVTYISQVDFGGRLPSRLVNFISKRQPLAVAYLRDYLEAAER